MSQIWDIYCKHCLWSIFGPCWCTKSCKNHLLCAYVANLKIGVIYALYPESFCDKNLVIRKDFAFSDSAHTECATSACRVIFGGYRVMPPLRQHIGKDSRSLQLSGNALSGKYKKKTRVRSTHTPKTNTCSKGKEDLYIHLAMWYIMIQTNSNVINISTD